MDRHELYGLPLDRFVVERGVLVKSLRGAGRREEAAEIAALRKPSVAAWAVNRLVRAERPKVEELFAAGDALRAAQAALLAGGGDARAALREAGERERAAVDRLVQDAAVLLRSAGHEPGSTVIDRVADTLHAGALDEAAREQVARASLPRELRHVGLGQVGISGQAPAAPGRGVAKAPPAGRGKREQAREVTETAASMRGKGTAAGTGDAARARAAQAELEREAQVRGEERRRARAEAAARRRAERAEAAARRQAERATEAAAAAVQQRDRAAQALAEADEALVAAQSRAVAADAELRRARQDLDTVQ